MSEVLYTTLNNLIDIKPEQIELIKEQYLLLLSDLTSTTYIETELFEKNIKQISEMGQIIIGIMYDKFGNFDIIASGTIIIEPKIIRGGRNVGHIEDVVVSKEMRGKGISKEILQRLETFARLNDCYKIILDCNEAVKNIYAKSGFNYKGIQMAKYF